VGRHRKIQPKTYRVETKPNDKAILVIERGTEIPVAKFKHTGIGHASTIALLTAVIHSLQLEEWSTKQCSKQLRKESGQKRRQPVET
jgi:hypothetical protein